MSAIAFIAAVLALVIGYAVSLAMYRPRPSAEFLRAKALHDAARRQHKPSKNLHRNLVNVRTKELA